MEEKGDEKSKSKHIFGALAMSFSLMQMKADDIANASPTVLAILWQQDFLLSTHELEQTSIVRISHKSEVD